jgi:hypothetical protein
VNFLQPIGRVFLEFLSTAGRLLTLAVDNNLHPSEKGNTPLADTNVHLAETGLLKREAS